LIDKNRELGNALQLLHKVLNVLFMLTIAGHTAAALWHHVWRKDETLRRMGWRFSK
jgi:cytochrome b561